MVVWPPRLERGDDENLVLMRVPGASRPHSQVCVCWPGPWRSSRGNTRTSPREALREELPWLPWLPESERNDCLRELLANLLAGADTGHLIPFAQGYWSWKSTAEVRSDPELG